MYNRKSIWASAVAGVALWATSSVASAAAVISNGTVQLGVDDYGQLNVPGPVSGTGGTSYVGLRYVPTNFEATADGCICEGWGVADETTAVAGWANNSSGHGNLQAESFTADASTATSVVLINGLYGIPALRVTHAYAPSAKTASLYDVTVTIENLTAAPVVPRYRRVMDWDIEPTAFYEYSTVQTGTSTEVLFSSDDGFASSNPLAGASAILFAGTAVDSGPYDHGALFDFRFESLAPGAKKTFHVYYGAAPDEAGANMALAAVGAEVYSFGQATTDADGLPTSPDLARPDLGKPGTFIFAFSGVGGDPVIKPDQITLTPDEATSLINREYCFSVTLLDGEGQPKTASIFGKVTGVNTIFISTSTYEGSGSICYSSAIPGVDTVAVGTEPFGLGISDTSTLTWADLHATKLVAGPALQLNTSGSGGRITATPSATLTSGGSPLAGREVVFTAGNSPFCTAVTNAAGVATCSSLLVRGSGLVDVLVDRGYTATFAGDSDYTGSTAHGALTARQVTSIKPLKSLGGKPPRR